MPADWNRLLAQLSRADLQQLLAAKAKIEDLEKRRDELVRELAIIDRDLARLVASETRGRRTERVAKAAGRKRTGRKPAKATAPAKKAGAKKRQTPAGKTKAKRAGKAGQTTRAAAGGRKKTAAGAVKKTAARRGGRTTLDEVIVATLKEHGDPMPFKALLTAIVRGKRFATRSKNFDNVLRRTLSTSKRVKRKARGVYGL